MILWRCSVIWRNSDWEYSLLPLIYYSWSSIIICKLIIKIIMSLPLILFFPNDFSDTELHHISRFLGITLKTQIIVEFKILSLFGQTLLNTYILNNIIFYCTNYYIFITKYIQSANLNGSPNFCMHFYAFAFFQAQKNNVSE